MRRWERIATALGRSGIAMALTGTLAVSEKGAEHGTNNPDEERVIEGLRRLRFEKLPPTGTS